ADAAETLAEAADGYRTLEGWLARLALSARQEKRGLDRDLVEPILAEEGRANGLTIEKIARAVAAQFGVRLRELRAHSRRKVVVEPRRRAMPRARGPMSLSLGATGVYFGGRDPASVRHACRKAANRLSADPALAATMDTLRLAWRNGQGEMDRAAG